MNEFELVLELDRVSKLTTKASLKQIVSGSLYKANRNLYAHYDVDVYTTSTESLEAIKASNMHYSIANAAVARYAEIFDDAHKLPQYTRYTVPTVAIHLSLVECKEMLTMWANRAN